MPSATRPQHALGVGQDRVLVPLAQLAGMGQPAPRSISGPAPRSMGGGRVIGAGICGALGLASRCPYHPCLGIMLNFVAVNDTLVGVATKLFPLGSAMRLKFALPPLLRR